MPVFPGARPTIRARVRGQYPYRIVRDSGIKADLSGGTLTIGLSYDEIAVDPAPDRQNYDIVARRRDTGEYRVVGLPEAGSETLGIGDLYDTSPIGQAVAKAATAPQARLAIDAAPGSQAITGTGLAASSGTLSSSPAIDIPKASQAEAEAGTIDTKAMTPLRVTQRIAAGGPALADAPLPVPGSPRVISAADRARMLHRPLMEFIDRSQWPMIEAGTARTNPSHPSVVSVRDDVQTALASGSHIRMPDGWVPIGQSIYKTREGQQIEGFSRGDSGFVALPGLTLTPGTSGIISEVPYGVSARYGVYCVQPTNPANFAALITYPPCWYIAASQRVTLECIAYVMATVGIDGWGDVSHNTAGSMLRDIRGSAFDTDIRLGGFYDFTELTNLHAYWDGYENNTVIQGIVNARPAPIALDVGYCESLNVGDLKL